MISHARNAVICTRQEVGDMSIIITSDMRPRINTMSSFFAHHAMAWNIRRRQRRIASTGTNSPSKIRSHRKKAAGHVEHAVGNTIGDENVPMDIGKKSTRGDGRMAEVTEISWTDSTWSAWWGCTALSPACDNCYAKALDKRTGGNHWGNVPRRRTSPENWKQPLRWQKAAGKFYAEHGRRRRVFVSSMSDFYDNQVDPQWRADAWDVIRACPDIDWLILTKRPQNIRAMLPAFWDEIKERIWSGTTVEDMTRARQNIPHILNIDSRYRFISGEPLLAPIFLRSIPVGTEPTMKAPLYLDALEGVVYAVNGADGARQVLVRDTGKLDWVIAGGESGHGARPMHPWWPELLQEDCEATGTAFLWKQWGNYMPPDHVDSPVVLVQPWGTNGQANFSGPPPAYMTKTVRKITGTLRGIDYKEFPNG
jgi:protein gp37